jgi:hypothetical protein
MFCHSEERRLKILLKDQRFAQHREISIWGFYHLEFSECFPVDGELKSGHLQNPHAGLSFQLSNKKKKEKSHCPGIATIAADCFLLDFTASHFSRKLSSSGKTSSLACPTKSTQMSFLIRNLQI